MPRHTHRDRIRRLVPGRGGERRLQLRHRERAHRLRPLHRRGLRRSRVHRDRRKLPGDAGARHTIHPGVLHHPGHPGGLGIPDQGRRAPGQHNAPLRTPRRFLHPHDRRHRVQRARHPGGAHREVPQGEDHPLLDNHHGRPLLGAAGHHHGRHRVLRRGALRLRHPRDARLPRHGRRRPHEQVPEVRAQRPRHGAAPAADAHGQEHPVQDLAQDQGLPLHRVPPARGGLHRGGDPHLLRSARGHRRSALAHHRRHPGTSRRLHHSVHRRHPEEGDGRRDALCPGRRDRPGGVHDAGPVRGVRRGHGRLHALPRHSPDDVARDRVEGDRLRERPVHSGGHRPRRGGQPAAPAVPMSPTEEPSILSDDAIQRS